MARLNIYLQEDLAASVKRAGLETSAICQQALREAVEAREQGISTKIETLRAPVRLRRTTPQGRRAAGAAEGARWARETATLAELQDMDEVTVEQLDDVEGEDPMYMVHWENETGSQSFLDVGSAFETLGPWLLEQGSKDVAYKDLSGKEADLGLDADEYLAGFVDAAKRVWHELKPLVEEDETVLRRQIDVLTRMEHNMLASGDALAPGPEDVTQEADEEGEAD